MTSRFSSSIAACVLLAAGAAKAQEYNHDNGVHAVPTRPVAIAPLARIRAAAPAETSAASAPSGPARRARQAPVMLTLQLSPPVDPQVTNPAPAIQPMQISDVSPVALDGGPPGLTPVDYRPAPADLLEPEAADADAAASETAPDAAPASADQPLQQHVAFPRRSLDAAAAFDRYMHSAASIGPGLKAAGDVADALRTAAAYEPRQLEEGEIAYGAIAALQDARFVYGVMDAAANARSRRQLADELLADPDSAVRLPGAGEASALAVAAILREARPVIAAGVALKQASYDIQHQQWSAAPAADATSRLAQAKSQSATPLAAGDGDLSRVLVRISAFRDMDSRQPDGSASRAARRSLALAAVAILDDDQDRDSDRIDALFSDPAGADCLKMAKLNLFQCLSAAGPEYEDVFCLAEHAVLDTGRCVSSSASPAAVGLLSARGPEPTPWAPDRR